jgi:hypothetical protein
MSEIRRPFLLVVFVLALGLAACGGSGGSEEASDPGWASSPEKVVEGLMTAYTDRNDSLYAALLADEFRYTFVPAGTDSAEVLGWGKEEDLVATANLFRTPDVTRLTLDLRTGAARESRENPDWTMVPVAGGQLRVEVADREPMVVDLNRQEIHVRPDPQRPDHWQVIAWYDFPAPEAP